MRGFVAQLVVILGRVDGRDSDTFTLPDGAQIITADFDREVATITYFVPQPAARLDREDDR